MATLSMAALNNALRTLYPTSSFSDWRPPPAPPVPKHRFPTGPVERRAVSCHNCGAPTTKTSTRCEYCGAHFA